MLFNYAAKWKNTFSTMKNITTTFQSILPYQYLYLYYISLMEYDGKNQRSKHINYIVCISTPPTVGFTLNF